MSNHLDARYDQLLKQIEKIAGLKFKDEIPKDIYDLITELQTNQIELEMQNEELQNVQKKLENLQEKYLDLYNFSPIGLFTLNEDKLITDANLTGVNLLNIEKENIINTAFVFFLTDKSQIIFSGYGKKALETQTIQNCELEFIKKDGNCFNAFTKIKPIINEAEDNQLQIALMDIKEDKKPVKQNQGLLSQEQQVADDLKISKLQAIVGEVKEENEELKMRLLEAEETLNAIQSGEVDAIVISSSDGNRVYSLEGGDKAYRTLVEEMNEGAAILTDDRTIFYCNNHLAEMVKVPLEEMIGNSLDNFISQNDRLMYEALIRKGLEKDNISGELSFISNDGIHIPAYVSVKNLKVMGLEGISVIITDLTEQKHAEDIIVSERLSRCILNQAGENIIVCDENGTIIRASDISHNLCNFNLLIKENFDEIFNLLDENNQKFSIYSILRGKTIPQTEVFLKQEDGHVLNLLLNARNIISSKNKIIGCVVTLTDITRLKKAEEQIEDLLEETKQFAEKLQSTTKELRLSNEELRNKTEEVQIANEKLWQQGGNLARVNQALRKSDKRLNRSQEIAHIGSWELDIANNSLYWSDETYRIFGLRPQVFGATYDAFLEAVHPDDRKAVDEAYSGSIREGKDAYEIEHQVVRKSTGEIRFVHEKCKHIRDETGQIIRSVGMVHDITERKKAEEQIKNLLEKSQQLNEELEISNEELRATTDELHVANEELRDQGEILARLNRTLRALSDSDHAMLHAENEAEYLDEVCNIIIEDCGYAMIWIGFAEDNENKTIRPVAQCGFDEGYIENLNITWADTERGRGPTGTTVRTGKPTICKNMLTDPNFAPWREEAVKRGYASSMVVPLIADNKTLGAISIYSREPDSFIDEEVKLLVELANDLAFGITNLRLRAENERAEMELRENEQKLRTLFEISPVGISIIDKDRNVVYENPALERILDISKKDIMEKSYEKRQYIRSDGTIIPLEEMPSARALKENKAVENVEIGVIKEDKSIIWTNISATPLSFPDWNVLITTSDITERKQAEKELAESEERYRLILETANSGVFLLDTENNVKYLNQSMVKILGYSAQEMLNKDLTQFLDTKEQKNIHKFMDEWKKGMNRLNEFKFIRKDGSAFWALLAASPVLDINGKYVGVIGVITDINARKGVEKALMDREKISKAILYDMMGMINSLIKKETAKDDFSKLGTSFEDWGTNFNEEIDNT